MIRKSRRELAFFTVKKNKIDIGTVIELAAAQFAKSQDGKIGRGRAKRFPEFCIPMGKDFAHANFGELGQFGGCFFECRCICQLAQCDPGHFLIFPAAKNLEVIYCDITIGSAIKFVRHLDLISTLPADFRLRKPEQKLRILDNPGRTDARDGEEVKKRRLA